jgi:hypothetical protein
MFRLLVAATLSLPLVAQAQETPAPAVPATVDTRAPDPAEAAAAPPAAHELLKQEPTVDKADQDLAAVAWRDSRIDFVGMLGASLDKTAFAGSVGARLRFAKDWHVGLHAEYNPYGSVSGSKLRAGSANFFGSIDYRWMKGTRVALLTIGYLGVSDLLFNLYGVPKGTVGPYFGITPLCAEVRLSKRMNLLIESTRFAFPLPQTGGVPFGFRQYRFEVGLAVALD